MPCSHLDDSYFKLENKIKNHVLTLFEKNLFLNFTIISRCDCQKVSNKQTQDAISLYEVWIQISVNICF